VFFFWWVGFLYLGVCGVSLGGLGFVFCVGMFCCWLGFFFYYLFWYFVVGGWVGAKSMVVSVREAEEGGGTSTYR